MILKVVATNICGSDQHMVRGRTTAPKARPSATRSPARSSRSAATSSSSRKGDLVSVPFNIACGRCRNCKEGKTGVCLNVNPARAGAAYGYVDMGGWVGGQAEYVMVPYADLNLLKFPDRDQAMAKIQDLAMLSDIFPTGYHGAFTAGVTTGSTVYVAGAGPVGLACATSAHLLGRGRGHRRRHEQGPAQAGGQLRLRDHRPVAHDDLRGADRADPGRPEVDAAVDCVGFEARGHGDDAQERPRRRCSTRSWTSPGRPGGSASPGCT